MRTITIEGEAVDMPNSEITLNKTVINISDISERGINFTNSITLPFTAKNDRLTGYPSRLASNNSSFETKKRYSLIDDAGIISTGDLIVKSFNDKKGIKIQLAEGFDFWNQAGNKLLNDLVLHDLDFVFNDTNMDARKTRGSDVFVTALHSATGDGGNTAATNYDYTRPCVYFRRVLDIIVDQLGYELDYSNTLDITGLNDIGCLSNADDFFLSDFKYRIQDTNSSGGLDISAGTSVFTKSGNVSLSGTTLTNGGCKTAYVIKGWVSSQVDTSILLDFDGNIERILVPAGRTFINFKSDDVEIATDLIIKTETAVTFEDVYIYSAISEGELFELNSSVSVDGYLVLSDYNLPQMTCKQFIKALFKLFFLDFEVNEQLKTLTAYSIQDRISVNNTIDLSDSISRYFEVKSGSMYAQLNLLEYENDEDVGAQLGNVFFSVKNEGAKESANWLKVSEFSASREITSGSGNTFINVRIYTEGENKRESVANRLVFLNETGTFGINASFSQLGWSRLYSEYYFSFIESTKRERTTVFTARLTKLQFRNLQKSPVFYVRSLNANFLATKIEGFKNDGECKISAIKYG